MDEPVAEADTPSELAGWPRPAGLVLADDGSPRQLYHGTRAQFSEFRRSTTGEFGPGVYLTDHPGEAAEYGSGKREERPGEGVRIMPVYAAIRQPFTQGPDAFWSRFGGDGDDAAAVARAQAAGFDGIIYRRPLRVYDAMRHTVRDTGEQVTHYVVFDPRQVRSVFHVGERPRGEAVLASRAAGFYFDAQDSDLYRERDAATARATPVDVARAAIARDRTALRILQKGLEAEEGQLVGIRLNINVLKSTGVAVNSVHRGGKSTAYQRDVNRGLWNGEVITYQPVVTLRNAYLNVHQRSREEIAAGERAKMPMASVDGNFVATDEPNFDGVEFRFNPKREHLFRDAYGRVLRYADEVTVSGNSVFARGMIEYFGPEDEPQRAGSAPTQGRLLHPGRREREPLFSRDAVPSGRPEAPAGEDGKARETASQSRRRVRQAVAELLGRADGRLSEGLGRVVVTTTRALAPLAGRRYLIASAHGPRLASLSDDKDFRRMLADIRAAHARALAAIGDIGDGVCLRNGPDQRWVMVLADASTPGKWRIQYFDTRGFSGHEVYPDKKEALDAAVRLGFKARDDDALERLVDTPAFQQGLYAADLIRRHNMGELSFREVNELMLEYQRKREAMCSLAGVVTQAFHDPADGTTYLVADRIRPGSEQAVFMHECVHKFGRTVMGPLAWVRLLAAPRTWGRAPLDSIERRVHDLAFHRALASGERGVLFDEELFAYSVETAVALGVRPRAMAAEGSAEHWLHDVVSTLTGVLQQMGLGEPAGEQASGEAAARAPARLTLQQAVDFAYALAQLENPARAAEIRRELARQGPQFEAALTRLEMMARGVRSAEAQAAIEGDQRLLSLKRQGLELQLGVADAQTLRLRYLNTPAGRTGDALAQKALVLLGQMLDEQGVALETELDGGPGQAAAFMPLGFQMVARSGGGCVAHRAPRARASVHDDVRQRGIAAGGGGRAEGDWDEGTGGPDRPFDFARDARFHHLFYGQPSSEEVREFGRWLRQNRNAFVRLYHGTAAVNPVLQEGLLPATQRRRNSLHSSSGYVCLSVYPGMAHQFGVYASLNRSRDAQGRKVLVYPVVKTIGSLLADRDQLSSRRHWAGERLGDTLAESLVHGHGARVRGAIEPHQLLAPVCLEEARPLDERAAHSGEDWAPRRERVAG